MLKIYRNKENNFTSFIEPSFKKLFQLYEKSCLYSYLKSVILLAARSARWLEDRVLVSWNVA